MIGKGNLQEPIHITAQEAVALSKHDDIRSIFRAEEVLEAWKNPVDPNLLSWDTMMMLATVYQRGRIQGIREQRAKAKAKTAHPALIG